MASAFEIYLRIGRRVSLAEAALETKFNPWHNPDDGRFTFAGQGRFFPGRSGPNGAEGAGRSTDGQRGEHRSRHDPKNPRNYSIYTVRRGDTLTKIAEQRQGLTTADLSWLNEIGAGHPLRIGQKIKLPHQKYLDDGRRAREKFLALASYIDLTGKLPPNAAQPPTIATQIEASSLSTIRSNGYSFDADDLRRPRRAAGELQLRSEPRSRSAQADAGKPDRRTTDDGGHFIASVSVGPEHGSIILPKMPISIVASTVRSKINGPKLSDRVSVCLSTLSLGIAEPQCDPISSLSYGLSKAGNRSDASPTKGADDRMHDEKFATLGPLLNEIGGEIAAIVGGDPAGTYLYAEAGEGWIGSSLFKDEGSAVRYYDTTDELDDLLLEVRETEESGMRWVVMEYEVNGTKFDAQFKYLEEVDVASFDEDRREIPLESATATSSSSTHPGQVSRPNNDS